MSVETTIDFLSAALRAMRLESGRSGKHDLFADRLVKSASEPTLAGAMEHLLRSIDASTDDIHPPLAARMIAVACGPDGPRILRWWREQAKLVTLIAATKDDEARAAAIAEVQLPPAPASGAQAPLRGEYDVGIHALCTAPLSHGSDMHAGNATLFRRGDVICDSGDVLHLPIYAGNALRGQIRDLLSDHLLESLGIAVSRAQPVVALWFFHLCYSGGKLEENAEVTKALKKRLGDHGAIRAEGVSEFRTMLPAISVLGTALGDRGLNGRCMPSDLHPICYEWGTGARPVAELLGWEFLTRREDHEGHEKNSSMIAATEVLIAGTELEGGIDIERSANEIERGALARGLLLLRDFGYLGGANRRGFGKVDLSYARLPDPAPYDEFLAERRDDIREYLTELGALVPAAA